MKCFTGYRRIRKKAPLDPQRLLLNCQRVKDVICDEEISYSWKNVGPKQALLLLYKSVVRFPILVCVIWFSFFDINVDRNPTSHRSKNL